MSNRKTIENFKSRRTTKIIETVADREKRQDNLLLTLNSIADDVLSGRHKNIPVPTDEELDQLAISNPDIAALIGNLFYVVNNRRSGSGIIIQPSEEDTKIISDSEDQNPLASHLERLRVERKYHS